MPTPTAEEYQFSARRAVVEAAEARVWAEVAREVAHESTTSPQLSIALLEYAALEERAAVAWRWIACAWDAHTREVEAHR